MSVTIEDVMHLAHAYASQEADGCASVSTSAYDDLYSVLTALVAQARDEEAEACAQVCDHIGNKPTEAYLDPFDCATAIRARIAGRKA